MPLSAQVIGAAAAGLLSAGIGGLSVLFGYRRRRRFQALARLATATGRVVRVRRNSDGGTSSVVEYDDVDGTTLMTFCDLGQKNNVVGRTATVAYDPTNPAGNPLVKEEAENVTTGWIVGSVFLVIGAVLLTIAVLDGLGVQPP